MSESEEYITSFDAASHTPSQLKDIFHFADGTSNARICASATSFTLTHPNVIFGYVEDPAFDVKDVKQIKIFFDWPLKLNF